MAAEKKYPLSLIIRAVDKVTGPLAKITAALNSATAPGKQLGKGFAKFSEAAGFKNVFAGIQGVGGAVKNVANEAVALGLRFFALGGAATFAFYSVVRGAVDAGDKLQEVATRLGVNVDFLASYQRAAELADIPQEELNDGLDKFSKNLGAAKAGGGALLEFLKKVSPNFAEQIKNAKGVEQGLSLMTDAMVRLQDPTKRAELATVAFGRSGAQFGTFLHQGSAAIQKQQIEFLRLAGSQDKFAASASELDDAMRDVGTAFSGVRAAIAGALFPAFTQMSHAVTEFIVANRDGISKWAQGAASAITAWVNDGGIQRLVGTLGRLADRASEFIDAVGGIKTIAIAAGAVMAGPLLLSIAGLVPAFASLGAALLATPFGWFVLAAGAVATIGILVWKNWAKVKAFFQEFFPGFTAEVTKAVDGVMLLVDAVKALIELKQSWDDLSSPGGNFARSVDQKITDWIPSYGKPGAGASLGGAAGSASVKVDFANVPKGVRVTQSTSNAQPVDLSVGYSMSGN